MKENQMHLINKVFNDKTIRIVWDKEQEKYFISVVDIVGVVSESKDQQAYWRKLKQRLKEEGNETVTNCHGLKMTAADGKKRMTDIATMEQFDTDTYDMEQSDNDLPPMMFHSFRYSTITYKLKWGG